MHRQHPRLRAALIWGVLVCLLAGTVALLLVAERADRPFWETLENAVIVLMGEYPDRPASHAGRVLQLLLLVFGTLVFGAIIGKVSSLFVTHALRKESAVKPFSDHIIICNWNAKAPRVIEQLLEAQPNDGRDVVVVSASEIPAGNEILEQPNVHVVRDDPTHHATLEKLSAHEAKSIILLADEDTPGPDDKNALIALAVKHLEQEPGKEKDIHVIAELLSPDRRRHLMEAGVDEIVSGRDYSSGIIAQSALFRNMSVVYQRLLTYSNDTNELYFIAPGNYPAEFVGRAFPELCQGVSERSAANEENPLLLLGVKRDNGEILLNPQKKSFGHLKTNDSLIIMAFHNVERI
ncbi:MAG: potassium transporter [Lentisphaerae bacterium]|jgi:voltage-gated potassium channel|nr:potassium transporter [Lentisphaerota bacterium]MBT5612919.1 potassium transporter [Lentisphaerota bacterium]MBT7061863.1 potassium transporter [Lentisphaerota bacterium]MBT7846963.1 potassium transporter [Lentisphaerota bacterium]